ncbi:hypothetical protein [Methanofollis fontis]|uniref:Uncharacterized protein n=1 Tax=Methanofollis fontis TaxID=2052832 RepID=A0A483CU36_9EURY|nr:hypothetical protein [Methanofollis fontis]TAJ44953.1 hypothetical protein CUJ86_06645 [Methanofollis fontis]
MDLRRVLQGTGDPLPIHERIAAAISDISSFPDLIEPIYQETAALSDDELDRLRFSLIRVQIYADVHRYENMELSQRMKYVAGVLEKMIFGSLMLEGGESASGGQE